MGQERWEDEEVEARKGKTAYEEEITFSSWRKVEEVEKSENPLYLHGLRLTYNLIQKNFSLRSNKSYLFLCCATAVTLNVRRV